jgi:hypothetical protein
MGFKHILPKLTQLPAIAAVLMHTMNIREEIMIFPSSLFQSDCQPEDFWHQQQFSKANSGKQLR